jgi:hypothetical protein
MLISNRQKQLQKWSVKKTLADTFAHSNESKKRNFPITFFENFFRMNLMLFYENAEN